MTGTDVTERLLSEKQLDYILVYSQLDKEMAEDIHQKLKEYGLDGRLYDDPSPFDDWYLTSEIEIITDLSERSTFKFFLASSNLVDEKEEQHFITQKSEALIKAMYHRDQSVIPIWLEEKKEIDKSTSRVLYGLMALQGLNPRSKYFEENVKKLHQTDMFVKKKEERERVQKERLEKHMAKKRLEEQQMKEEEQKRKEREARRPKKEHAVVNGFHKDAAINLSGVQGSVNIYNVSVNDAKSVNIGGGSEVEQMQANMNAVQETCYDAPERYWSSFDEGGATAMDVHSVEDSYVHVQGTDGMEVEDLANEVGQTESRYSHDAPSSRMDNSTTDISSAFSH